jgi:hypothetical protein
MECILPARFAPLEDHDHEKESQQTDRRDANFKRLQEIRMTGEWFAVIRGYIVEL